MEYEIINYELGLLPLFSRGRKGVMGTVVIQDCTMEVGHRLVTLYYVVTRLHVPVAHQRNARFHAHGSNDTHQRFVVCILSVVTKRMVQ
jgi:hypothetical protein